MYEHADLFVPIDGHQLINGPRVLRANFTVKDDGVQEQILTLSMEPLSPRVFPAEPLLPVILADGGAEFIRAEASGGVSAAQKGTASHLRKVACEMSDRLQHLIEEYDTALQDLQSAEMELFSRSMELQGRHENIEALREELDAVNQELEAMNVEPNGKRDALDRANADLRNLFDITDVATVFLDAKLLIRSFTPAVAKVFDIRPTDAGRPITDLATNLHLTTLRRDIEAVFAGAHAIEMTAGRDEPEANFLIRITPYRDREQTIQGVVVTFIDVTSLARAEARQCVLMGELQHRTRNLLAIVQSIARQTLGKGGALGDFTARLEALGRVQKLAGGQNEERFDLRDIVDMEVNAVAGCEPGKVSMTGPAVALTFQQVQTFALVLHELCTNAVKHGALRLGPGRVEIAWEVEGETPDRSLAFRWRETGVGDIQPPQHRGFGTIMIERASGFARNTRSEMRFDAQGVDWRIRMALPEAPTLVAIAELERST